MSASLVGSEMCIRDRLIPDAAARCRDALCHAAHLSRQSMRIASPWGCLLYTSDAADDMQCRS
eukprot:5719660-Alexandrium_andersonii.AAC.1